MTEWERLQKGLIYNDFDEDLFNKRVEAKKLFKAYNKTEDDEIDLRNKIMQSLFKSVGKNVWIEQISDVNLVKILRLVITFI